MGVTHHQQLAVEGTTTIGGAAVISGNVTMTGSGKAVAVTGLSSTGTTTLGTPLTLNALHRGKRTIATGGSSSISNALAIGTTAYVQLTARSTTKNANANLMSIGGGSMKVGLFYGLTPTAATGTIYWLLTK